MSDDRGVAAWQAPAAVATCRAASLFSNEAPRADEEVHPLR